MLYFVWWIGIFYIVNSFQKDGDGYCCINPLIGFYFLSALIYLAYSISFLLLITFSKLKPGYEVALYITQVPLLIILIKAMI